MIVLTKTERRALIIITGILFISLLIKWFQPSEINTKIYDYSMEDSLFKALSDDTILTTTPIADQIQKKPLKSTQTKKKAKETLQLKSININTAGEKELIKLPRIGPKTAKLIIEYRETHGNFKNINDIINVKRIGTKTLERIAPYIFVERDSSQQSDY